MQDCFWHLRGYVLPRWARNPNKKIKIGWTGYLQYRFQTSSTNVIKFSDQKSNIRELLQQKIRIPKITETLHSCEA